MHACLVHLLADSPDLNWSRVARANNLSLRVGISCDWDHKDNRQRFCRYLLRAVDVPRLLLSPTGNRVCNLRTLYRDGCAPAERHAVVWWLPYKSLLISWIFV